MTQALSRNDLQAQLEAADRELGKQSLFYFAKFCLGYDLLQRSPHKDVCEFAEMIVRHAKLGLDLEPRGAFKTSIFSQALPVWLILHNPNVRILLDSEVLQNSLDNLKVIKAHLDSPRLKFLYGDHVGKDWTQESVTVAKRTDLKLKEPTVRVASPEVVQVGPHYDVIIADDLVSETNVSTPEQIKKIKSHVKLLFSLLDPGGILILVGTRWHYDDVYGMVIDEYNDFQKRIKSALTGGPSGGLYFPERLTEEFLAGRKTKLGRDLFSSQYLNDPAPEDDEAKFHKSMFVHYRDLPERKYAFLTIDPGGEKKGSDEWVFFKSYMDEESYRYFDSLIKGNMKLSKAVDLFFDICEKLQPISIGLETTGAQKYILETLNDEMRRRGKFYHIVELAHAGATKQQRILKLQPLYQAGAIRHSRHVGELEDQLRRFPRGKDDIADAAAMTDEVMVAPRKMKRERTEIKSVDDLIRYNARHGEKVRHVHNVLGSEM